MAGRSHRAQPLPEEPAHLATPGRSVAPRHGLAGEV